MLRAAASEDVGAAFGASGPLLVYAVGALALTLAAVATRRSVRLPKVAGGRAVAA